MDHLNTSFFGMKPATEGTSQEGQNKKEISTEKVVDEKIAEIGKEKIVGPAEQIPAKSNQDSSSPSKVIPSSNLSPEATDLKTQTTVTELGLLGQSAVDPAHFQKLQGLASEVNHLRELSLSGKSIDPGKAQKISQDLADLKLVRNLSTDTKEIITILQNDLINVAAGGNDTKLTSCLKLEQSVTDKLIKKFDEKSPKNTKQLQAYVENMCQKYGFSTAEIKRESNLHQCSDWETKLRGVDRILDRLSTEQERTGLPLSLVTTIEKAWSRSGQFVETKKVQTKNSKGGIAERDVTIVVEPKIKAFVLDVKGSEGGFKSARSTIDYCLARPFMSLVPKHIVIKDTHPKMEKRPQPVGVEKQKDVPSIEGDTFIIKNTSPEARTFIEKNTLPDAATFIEKNDAVEQGTFVEVATRQEKPREIVKVKVPQADQDRRFAGNNPEQAEALKAALEKGARIRALRALAAAQKVANAGSPKNVAPVAATTLDQPILSSIKMNPLEKMTIAKLEEVQIKLLSALPLAPVDEKTTIELELNNLKKILAQRKEDLEEIKNYDGMDENEIHFHDIDVNLRLAGSPGIIGVHTIIDLEQGTRIIIQEKAGFKVANATEPVKDLEEFAELKAQGKLTPDEEKLLLKFVGDAAIGYKSMHDLGFIHRDIKGGNVLITPDGQAKIADFGITCSVENDRYKTAVTGTPRFIAPEVAAYGRTELWKTISTRSDSWSFGMFLHEVFKNNERHPAIKDVPSNLIFDHYPALMKDHALQQQYEQKYPRPADENSMDFMIWKCTRLDPEQRPSMDDIIESLKTIHL